MAGYDTPIQVYVDASSDKKRSAFAALILEDGKKPRLIYGTGHCVCQKDVEAWGIKRALRRINTEHHDARPIVVFTDARRLVLERLGGHVRYCWVPRRDEVIQQLHGVANALRWSLPMVRPMTLGRDLVPSLYQCHADVCV